MSRRFHARRDQKFKSSPLKIYRPNRVCELLDIDVTTLWRWRKEGLLPEPAFKLGRIEGWTEQQLAALFKEQQGATNDH